MSNVHRNSIFSTLPAESSVPVSISLSATGVPVSTCLPVSSVPVSRVRM